MEWETVVGESQKVTPYWAPPDKDAAVSGRQTKLPDESVDNLPLLDNPEQLYEEILTGLLTVNDPPIPTLPVRLDRPVTFNPPLNTPKPVVVSDAPIPTLPVNETVKALDPEPTCKGEVGEVNPIPRLPAEVITTGL